MQAALDETDRRRTKQIAHNKANNITPKTIQKRIADIMEGAYSGGRGGKRGQTSAKVAESKAEYKTMTPDKAIKMIAKLEKAMFEHAKNLEFEEAAKTRDEITQLREQALL
jgi:excinuclease ABC subunit B